MNERGISIVILSTGNEKTIGNCLKAFQAQDRSDNIYFEILYVTDQNLQPNFLSTVKDWDHSKIPLKIIEIPQGDSMRKAAYLSAKYPLIGYFLDSNIPDPDWVYEALRFMDDHPLCVICGGEHKPIFLVEPPPWFHNYVRDYEIGTQGVREIEDVTHTRGYLWKNGMVIRKSFLEQITSLSSRFNSNNAKAGYFPEENTELSWLAIKNGHKLMFYNRLKLHNIVAPVTMSWVYIKQFYHDAGAASIRFSMCKYYFRQKRFRIFLFLIIILLFSLSLIRHIYYLLKYLVTSSKKVDNVNLLMVQYFNGRLLELWNSNPFKRSEFE